MICRQWFAAVLGSYALRFNFDIPQAHFATIGLGVMPLGIAHTVACWYAGLYRGMWMFASLPDLRRVLKAVALSTPALIVMVALRRNVRSHTRKQAHRRGTG